MHNHKFGIKEILYYDLLYIHEGKKEIVFNMRNQADILLSFKDSIYTAKALIVGFWPYDNKLTLPSKVLIDLEKLKQL